LKAQELFESIAESGAASGPEYGLFVDISTELEELLSLGLVCKMDMLAGRGDHSHFTLTKQGRMCVRPCLELLNPVPILKYKRKNMEGNISHYTLAELVLCLAAAGWQDTVHSKTRKIDPYTQGSRKVWYHHDGQKTSKLYLQALLLAPQFFANGLVEIQHFQSQAYYKSILDGCTGVLPNQPLAYYKLLQQQQSGKSESQTGAATKQQGVPDFDEPGLDPGLLERTQT